MAHATVRHDLGRDVVLAGDELFVAGHPLQYNLDLVLGIILVLSALA